MNQTLDTSSKNPNPEPEPKQNLNNVIFKEEFSKAIAYILALALLVVMGLAFTYFTDEKVVVNAFLLSMILLVMLINTIETIFIRLGNLIAGHKFYSAFLFLPMVNIATISGIIYYMSVKFSDKFGFSHTEFFIVSLMASMVFVHSALTIGRDDPKHYEKSLTESLFYSKKIFMTKKHAIIYRVFFSFYSIISVLLIQIAFP